MTRPKHTTSGPCECDWCYWARLYVERRRREAERRAEEAGR
jgi:hypothetical protein